MRELAVAWYSVLGTGYAGVAEPMRALAGAVNVPLVSALLLGLLGAFSPCQLTTNAGALAYVTRATSDRRTVARNALAYLLGKALVYTALGVLTILAGRQLAQTSVPVVVVARKLLGPLMIVIGLYFLRLVPLRLSLGFRLSDWLAARAGSGATGALLLGIAFAFAFCPTLFLLFFGLTIPLALQSPLGVLFPGAFAVGTTLPLLVLAALLSLGVGASKRYVRKARRADAWLRPAAGIVLILAGLNDTLVYWLL